MSGWRANDGELLLEEKPDELPVGLMVAEAAVHED
jgi:hypothetical protein